MVYFVSRAFMGGVEPVYRYPKKEECGVGKSAVVFNIDSVKDYAVVTEGVFDAIRVGDSGVAVLGTELSEEQLLKLSNSTNKCYILLDADAVDKAIVMAHKLLDYRIDVRVVVPPKGDPADYSREEIHNWLKEAMPFTFVQELHLRMKVNK
jgi:DNA primase